MDLTVYVDLLDDFATFAKNIENFLTLPVTLLQSLLDLNISADADVTSSAVEAFSSTEAGADADVAAGE